MQNVQQLANIISNAVHEAQSTRGAAQRGTIAGASVLVNGRAYSYEAVCPIALVDGKAVWVQVAENDVAVIIGA